VLSSGAAIAAAGAAAAAISRHRDKPSWKATHFVPGSGLDSRPTPDPAATPNVRLNAVLELKLVERVGDWAHVEASNGWTGWVDARMLVDQTPG